MDDITTTHDPPEDIPTTAAEIRLRHRRAWRFNPTHFITETLDVPMWEKQRGIVNALRNNRRVAVRSCNGSGMPYRSAFTSFLAEDGFGQLSVGLDFLVFGHGGALAVCLCLFFKLTYESV